LPRPWDIFCAIPLAITTLGPPTLKPTTKRIGFDGQISAALSSAANKTRIKLAQFINFLYIFS